MAARSTRAKVAIGFESRFFSSASCSPLGHEGDPIPSSRSPERSWNWPYFHFHSHFRFCFYFQRYVYSANRIRLSIHDRASATRSSGARYFTLLTFLLANLPALFIFEC